MANKPSDLELKFDGPPVRQLDGAPAEAIISSLNALQRMVYIIGMKAEGRALSERLKPTAKVKREYSVVCRAPRHGSHIQPFAVESQQGVSAGAAFVAREKLLATLRAFDSGDETKLEEVVPSARERWFLAQAATGLLPPEESGLEVMIRAGSKGPFAFKADRARALLKTYNTPRPPAVDEEVVVGKLAAIDYNQTVMTIKPGSIPTLKMGYPLPLEQWLQTNVRKRLRITGIPRFSARGDITTFDHIQTVSELEPQLEALDRFKSGGVEYGTNRPLSLPVTVLWADRLFAFQESTLGIDVVVDDLSELRAAVLSELDMLWRNYASAEISELDEEAREVKRALLSRFGSLAR